MEEILVRKSRHTNYKHQNITELKDLKCWSRASKAWSDSASWRRAKPFLPTNLPMSGVVFDRGLMFLRSRRWDLNIQMEWEKVSNSPGHTLCKSNNHLTRELHQTRRLPGKTQRQWRACRSVWTNFPKSHILLLEGPFLSLRSVEGGSDVSEVSRMKSDISTLIWKTSWTKWETRVEFFFLTSVFERVWVTLEESMDSPWTLRPAGLINR